MTQNSGFFLDTGDPLINDYNTLAHSEGGECLSPYLTEIWIYFWTFSKTRMHVMLKEIKYSLKRKWAKIFLLET